MSRRTKTDFPIETVSPEAREPRGRTAPEHPAPREPAADREPPAPPTPRPASQTDSGFGSFG